MGILFRSWRRFALALVVASGISGCGQGASKQEVAQREIPKNDTAKQASPTPDLPESQAAGLKSQPASAVDESRDEDQAAATETAVTLTNSLPDRGKAAASEPVVVEPLSQRQQERLLAGRLNGGMQFSFRQFANMFLVSSRLHFGVGIGLMTSSREIADTELQSPFPEFYEPTLREFLDAIALQTLSEWKYDPTNKHVKSDVKDRGPVKGLAIFEFREKPREKPFTVTLADGWQSEDKGHWLMLIPPSFPVGMDIYEMGTYSADDKADEEDLSKKVRAEVALEWAKRVHPDAEPDDMRPAKVGQYEALSFEALVPSQLGKDLRWRQWVFMAGDKCYFVVSTILPDLDDEIFPDVEKMLASFHVKTKPAD